MKSNDNWITVDLLVIPSVAVLNTQILRPDSLKQYKIYANWTGKFRFSIPYNYDGSTEFQDTLISNIFTVE
jgi:hypothetical protein